MKIDKGRVTISLIIFILVVVLKSCLQTKYNERKIKKSKDIGSYCLNNAIILDFDNNETYIPNDYLLIF